MERLIYSRYESPLGAIFLSADSIGLTGLWFEGHRYHESWAAGAPEGFEEGNCDSIALARKWLDAYFQGKNPGFTPPLHLIGSDFRQRVWRLLLNIPYGEVCTYGALAARLASDRGQMSAQAVGGAVGHNPVSIIVPCHRVVGASGSLTGYAGGMDRKRFLLDLEASTAVRDGSR